MMVDFETNFYKIKELVEGINLHSLSDFAFQFDVVGMCRGTFYVEYKNNVLSVQPYDYYDRTALIVITFDDLFMLMSGQIDFFEKLRENKVRIASKEADGLAKVCAFFDAAFLSYQRHPVIAASVIEEQKVNPWDVLRDQIENSEIDEDSKKQLLANLVRFTNKEVHILLVGATGCGKSSTINALFDTKVAGVGYGVDPETQRVSVYRLDNLYLHDSPGLGDSTQKDAEHIEKIKLALQETDLDGNAIIDAVLVVINGANKDMKTTFELIRDVIVPNLQHKDRILVGINYCDLAMGGIGWVKRHSLPDGRLYERLIEKSESVKKRIKDDTGIEVEPIFYSALYKYNISKLLSHLVKCVPKVKRIFLANKVNPNEDNFARDDTQFVTKKKTNAMVTARRVVANNTQADTTNSVVESLQKDISGIKSSLEKVESTVEIIQQHTAITPDLINDDYTVNQAPNSKSSYMKEAMKDIQDSLPEVEKQINNGVKEKIKLRFVDGLHSAAEGAKAGIAVAQAMPVIGELTVTKAAGAVIGAVGGFFSGIFGAKNRK